MATVAEGLAPTIRDYPQDRPLDRAVDRWIYMFMALWFIVLALTGFIPDSLMKIEMVRAGARAPFPIVLHMHAVLMGSFLLLLLAQTWLAAVGRCDLHRRLGLASLVIAPALVIVGFILAPTMYWLLFDAAQAAPPELAERAQAAVRRSENILLLQMRVGLMFPLLLAIGLRARVGNSGLHKRLMILAPSIALGAAITRITWLPTTAPASPLSQDLYYLLVITPLFAWDVIRHRTIHRAWWIWLAVFLPLTILLHSLWDTAWWHATARAIMGVA
jgi:hypothetical protein